MTDIGNDRDRVRHMEPLFDEIKEWLDGPEERRNHELLTRLLNLWRETGQFIVALRGRPGVTQPQLSSEEDAVLRFQWPKKGKE